MNDGSYSLCGPKQPLHGLKAAGWDLDEIFLLDRSEFDHGEAVCWGRRGWRSIYSGDAEVGVVHVFAHLGFWQA